MSDYGTEQEDDDVVGYISIKDYAYDESNPLHFGYFEEEDDSQNNLRIGSRDSILLPDEYIVNRRAIAIYPFVPENDNELELQEGDLVYIGYKHGQGWLVAENDDRSKTGLVPEEYVQLIEDDFSEEVGNREHLEHARPFYLTQMITQSMSKNPEDEWEDIDDEEADNSEPSREKAQNTTTAEINSVEHQPPVAPTYEDGEYKAATEGNALGNGSSQTSTDDGTSVDELASDVQEKLAI